MSGVEFEDLLSLVLARSRGEVGSDAVENALSSIVSAHAPSSSSSKTEEKESKSTSDRNCQSNNDGIIPDEGNYDDDSEGDIPVKTNTSKAKEVPSKKYPDIPKAKANDGISTGRKKSNRRERRDALEAIPLGKMGERMLITFGDGPCPDLEVVSAALLGTRKSLQRAILDARALRRRLKDNWHQARAVATQHRGKHVVKDELKKTLSGMQGPVVDSELSFRAMDGNADSLRFDVPCGFDVQQLETLFPEEMGAYERWKRMHDAYQENSGDIQEKPKAYDDDGEGLIASMPEKINSNRLIERLHNFDARTDIMNGDYYMNFADIRKGSFLPRWGPKSVSETPKKRGRPRKDRASWQHFHRSYIIFLHWIGFDPRSALSPPNEETTQALGYLAYDFFGKIVEEAVSLRLESDNRMVAKRNTRSESPVLELTGGDQLEKANIDQALAQVDLRSLYSSSNVELGKSSAITQLYFGPGFENRLELEMDEIFGSKEKSLSQEEMRLRKEEEHIFSDLPQLPTLLSNVSDVLDDNPEDDSAPTKKKRPDE